MGTKAVLRAVAAALGLDPSASLPDILLRADALRGFYISHGHKLPVR